MNDMSPREKYMVLGAAVFVGIVLCYIFIVSPQLSELEKLERVIPLKEKEIETCQELIAEYKQLKVVLDKQKKKIGDRGSSGFMQSYLDAEASALNITVASMVPKSIDVDEEFTEQQVDLKLERLTLNSLVSFLYKLKTSDKLLTVKNIRIKRRYDDHSLSDVSLLISTLTEK